MGRITYIRTVFIFTLLYTYVGLHTHAHAQVKSNAGVFDEGIRPQFKETVTPEERAKLRTLQMKKMLDLQSDTVKMVYKINLETEREYDEQVKNSPNMTAYDKAMLQKIKSNNEASLKQLLGEQAWQKYQYLQEQKRREQQLNQIEHPQNK